MSARREEAAVSEPEQEVGYLVVEHTRATGHSVTWDTEGGLSEAQCSQCQWPND